MPGPQLSRLTSRSAGAAPALALRKSSTTALAPGATLPLSEKALLFTELKFTSVGGALLSCALAVTEKEAPQAGEAGSAHCGETKTAMKKAQAAPTSAAQAAGLNFVMK